ncbi:MAG: hypothetical protein PVI57_23770 [Gemmatimonadota bacterium]|jgi:hypothetical protein
MTDETPRRGPWSPRNILIVGGLLVVAFLAGFVWQWVEARQARTERDEARLELTFQELENQLASAVIQAENESFESSRELMSRFFTGLQSNIGQAPTDARRELEQLLARRDAVITAVSRSDPASTDLLTRMYTRYQVAMGGPEVGIPIPAPRSVDTVPPTDTGTADTTGGADGGGGMSGGGAGR